ncbi:MAG: hypothetical protein ACFB6R_14560 [Alphaproteobacteria bacterium]
MKTTDIAAFASSSLRGRAQSRRTGLPGAGALSILALAALALPVLVAASAVPLETAAAQGSDTNLSLRGLKTRSDYAPRTVAGHLGIFAALYDGDAGGFGQGSLTAHNGKGLGVQGSGYVGGFGDDAYYSGEGHAFYRRTGDGGYLFGGIVRYDQRDESVRVHLGAEAELYPTETLTIFGEAGYENFRRQFRANENNPYALAGLGLYPNKAFGLFGTTGYVNDDFYGAVGTEFQPSQDRIPRLTVFADAGTSDGAAFARGGLRLYFGANDAKGSDAATLRDQHTKLGIRSHFIPFVGTGPEFVSPGLEEDFTSPGDTAE